MVRKLGPYIVGETLGEGGFSKVKLGTHEETGERVALKILKKKALGMNASTERQVRREIEAMALVSHPNVIQLKGVDWSVKYEQKDGKKVDICLTVLELATGGELFEFLAHTGCFEEVVARTYCHQLISGLAHCHDRGVVHRDLKPENLLLDENFVLKLADFGFSNVMDCLGDTMMYTEVGTPSYMAPEMFSNQGYDGRKCDLWSCGVIMFIMLAGFPPFQKPNANDWWFDKLLTGKHSLFWKAHCRNQYFSESTKDFLNKLLCPDPARRITVPEILRHDWFRGPTITHEALKAELSQRKVHVDSAREHERAQRLREQEEEEDMECEIDMCHDNVAVRKQHSKRGADEVPLAPPSMARFDLAKGLNSVSLDDEEDEDSDGDKNDANKAGKEGKAEAPDYEPSNVRCYTRFSTTASPRETLRRVTDALRRLGAQYSLNKSQFRLKAKVGAARLSVVARVFRDPANKGSSVVEFHRRAGDGLEYRDMYRRVFSQLSDIEAKPL